MHQVLTGQMWADHANGDGLDNTRINLRTGTPAQNLANRGKKPGCRSSYIGVTWHERDQLWHAVAGRKGAGYFKNEEDAARARDAVVSRIYGEFARLNFPHQDQDQGEEKITMSTFSKRTGTFSQWLVTHEAGAQDDPVAWLARQWKALEGNRPRVSSPSGIEKHLLTLAAGEPAQADQWTGYVHTAVAEATSRYKQAKTAGQSGSSTSSGEGVQDPLPGTNPATGKPVAVVGQNQWRAYPHAAEMGSCHTCGWPRGIADVGAGEQMMCAAGHVFEPQRPEPIGEAAPAGPLATAMGLADDPELAAQRADVAAAGGAGRTYDPSADAPGSVQPAPGAHSIELGGLDSKQVDLLDVLSIKLDAILAGLGLPTDPGQLAVLLSRVEASAPDPGDDGGLLAAMNGQAGQPVPDFGAWYGIADPAATDE